MNSKALRLLWILLVPAMNFSYYWSSLGSYFVSEDFIFLVRSQDPWQTFGSLQDRWVLPVGLVFWKLTVELFGYSAPAHRLCNLLVHFLNVALFYRLLRATIQDREVSLLAVVIFCLFLIHPEAVPGLSGHGGLPMELKPF